MIQHLTKDNDKSTEPKSSFTDVASLVQCTCSCMASVGLCVTFYKFIAFWMLTRQTVLSRHKADRPTPMCIVPKPIHTADATRQDRSSCGVYVASAI